MKEMNSAPSRRGILPAAWAEWLGSNPIPVDPKVPLGRVAMTKQVVHVADARMDQGYLERGPGMVAVVELGGGQNAPRGADA